MSPAEVSISKNPAATRSADGPGLTMSQRQVSTLSPSNSSLTLPFQFNESSGVMWNQSNLASTTVESAPASAIKPILGSSIPARALVSGISMKSTPSSL